MQGLVHTEMACHLKPAIHVLTGPNVGNFVHALEVTNHYATPSLGVA